jgi:catechol 2,3-dioxygenase-like lactoylglutathione lyase family enzyme
MPIDRIDHFTLVAGDAIASAEFYSSILELEPGPRPLFNDPGVWLYCGKVAILHIVEVEDAENCRGCLNHIAFWGRELVEFVWRLRARGIDFKLERNSAEGPGAGNWQLFFESPDGAYIEIAFEGSEPAPQSWKPIETIAICRLTDAERQ